MTALITVIMALNVFLVLMFGYPFSGDLRVDPSTYQITHRAGRHFHASAAPSSATSQSASSLPAGRSQSPRVLPASPPSTIGDE